MRLSSTEWGTSPERTRALKGMYAWAAIAMFLFVASFACYLLVFQEVIPTFFFSNVLCLLGFVALAFMPMRWHTAKASLGERLRLEDVQAKVKESVRESKPEPTMQNLININRAEMSGYHQLTLEQAAKSFKHSQISMYLGFALVALCVVFTAVPQSDAVTKLSVAGLGAAAAAISGFITKTFLKSHLSSISQLNRLFEQPLVSSYLLTAERLALELEQPNRDAVLGSVVSQALAAANSSSFTTSINEAAEDQPRPRPS